MKLSLWTIIPALMLVTSIFFIAFKDYTMNEWIIGNGIVSVGIGLIYIGENIYRRIKE